MKNWTIVSAMFCSCVLLTGLQAQNPDCDDPIQAGFGAGGTWNVYQGCQFGMFFDEAHELAGEEAFMRVPGQLASIHSVEENDFVHELGGLSNHVWIGLVDRAGLAPGASEGNFAWTSGEPVTYTNWSGGEPNNSGQEDVVHLRKNDSDWNDQKSNYPENEPIEDAGSLDETIGARSDFHFVIEYNTKSSTPFDGIEMGPPPPAPPKPRLVFVQQPNNIEFDDELIAHFEQNYEVQPFDSTDPDVIDAADEADVVYVTESIGSSSIAGGDGTIFQETETPVIYAEAFAWDDARLVAPVIHEDFGNTGRPEALAVSEDLDVVESIFIVDPNHPLAGGFSGAVQVHEDAFSVNYATIETMGPGAEVIATADEAGEFATIFVYEAGSELEDGTTTPGMRIGIFVSQSSSVPDVPTPIPFDILHQNGLALIDAAVMYAMGLGGILGDYNGNSMIDAGDLDVHAQYVNDNNPAGDLNGDGTTDSADRSQWVTEIQKSWLGDSNFDGEFSSSDFVAVFQAGKYETGQMAGYAEGDWNGDMLFDSGDFVAAFQAGGYEMGPLNGASVVPEPSGMVLALVGVVFLCPVVRYSREDL